MDYRAVTAELRDAPQKELFMYIVGDVGQIVPAPPASSRKGVFLSRPLTEKAAKYCGLVAGAEVTLLSRTSVFSFPGHKNWLESCIAECYHLQ